MESVSGCLCPTTQTFFFAISDSPIHISLFELFYIFFETKNAILILLRIAYPYLLKNAIAAHTNQRGRKSNTTDSRFQVSFPSGNRTGMHLCFPITVSFFMPGVHHPAEQIKYSVAVSSFYCMYFLGDLFCRGQLFFSILRKRIFQFLCFFILTTPVCHIFLMEIWLLHLGRTLSNRNNDLLFHFRSE